jgi:phosphoglycolate phosphatase
VDRRFDLLIFDWDGTLMDSTRVIVSALQAACRELELPVPTDRSAEYIIGLGLNDALAHVLPGIHPAEYPRIVERYGHYFRLGEPSSTLFPGVDGALRELRRAGYLLAVATGKSRRGLERALENTGLKDVFHATRCGEESASKPDPGMLDELMSIFAVEQARTLMIGDTTHDIQMAINAGIASVATAYGAHSREDLVRLKPLKCVDQPHELWRWLAENA